MGVRDMQTDEAQVAVSTIKKKKKKLNGKLKFPSFASFIFSVEKISEEIII